MNVVQKALARAQKSPDVVLAVAMTAVLAALIVPLPAWLLDVGLALNLAASASLLVAALYARDALKVTAFPTLLLFTTLFRLALNVSSTRLALADGHAGDVIEAFGEFVVRGDYLVGAVIFAILTLVQFLVVAKGSERVAEVSARFTLDAMPGKQMSIDADLRSGAIDQNQARARRRSLERESQMFGAMDGAMKFVKGDVIAGLVITAVNLLGGTAVGVIQGGMRFSEAASTYALIAIGDGLVSQLPSLFISVAAGLVVTRVASERDEDSLGSEIGSQFFGQSKILYVVSGLCVALALVPGMPHFTFLVIAGAAAALGRSLPKSAKESEAVGAPGTVAGEAASSPPAKEKEPGASELGITPLTLDLSPDLTELIEIDGGAFVTRDLERVRDQLYRELGVRVPGIRIRTHASYLQSQGYAFEIDEVPAGTGWVEAEGRYALASPADLSFLAVSATEAIEPATGRTISRVSKDELPVLEAANVPVRKGSELVCDHLLAILRRRAAALLGIQDVQALLDGFEPQAPALVKEALDKVPLPLLTEVLRKLLQEEVSIRNLRAILEALVAPATEGDAAALAERCRQALHRYLTHKYAPQGPLYAYLIDPALEATLREQALALDPSEISSVLESVERIAQGGRVVVLAAPEVRRTFRRLCEGAFPQVAVLTYGELDPELQIRPIGKVACA